ncbi:hypothetical protein [Spiroplasma kunkelii]|uniref:hypothetical protein n=1 Tax=Spiroplasma kunkelii TaxID=47834 RepID=UPI000320D24C|nr:hypothetical protein [Spiroplasma kunkelii]
MFKWKLKNNKGIAIPLDTDNLNSQNETEVNNNDLYVIENKNNAEKTIKLSHKSNKTLYFGLGILASNVILLLVVFYVRLWLLFPITILFSSFSLLFIFDYLVNSRKKTELDRWYFRNKWIIILNRVSVMFYPLTIFFYVFGILFSNKEIIFFFKEYNYAFGNNILFLTLLSVLIVVNITVNILIYFFYKVDVPHNELNNQTYLLSKLNTVKKAMNIFTICWYVLILLIFIILILLIKKIKK